MIYTLDGTPIKDALKLAGLRVAEQRHRHRPANFVMDGRNRAFKTTRDRNGDIIRVYREVHVHHSGAGFLERQRAKALKADAAAQGASLYVRITALMAGGLSQRKTAKALGIHLSKLQRTLAKGEPAFA